MNEVAHSRPCIDASDTGAAGRALAEGMIASGSRVRAFERAVAEYVGCVDAVATNSGTAALIAALKALEIPAESEIILPTYTCPAVMEAVRAVEAVPVPCDVGEHWNMTAETAARKLSHRTAAVIVVSTFGIDNPPAPYRELGVPVIEDRCQNFVPLPERGGQERGDLHVYSFHATKCLTTGEGGMVASSRADLLEKLQNRGAESPAGAWIRAARMSDLQASLGLSQLARYDRFLARRRSIAEQYFAELGELAFRLPGEVRGSSIFFRFPLRGPGKFDRWKERFLEYGIHVRRGVDTLLHRSLGLERREFPTAERLFAETVSIPIYPALTDREQERIVEACRDLADRK